MQTDTFEAEGPLVPCPATLRVTLCSARHNPSWAADHIVCTVTEQPSSCGDGGNGSSVYYFCCEPGQWLDAAASAAGSASVVLQASSAPPSSQTSALAPHTVRVWTSRLRGAGAGTAHGVSINVTGDAGRQSGWLPLPARADSFSPGQEDVFSIMLPRLGPISQLAVRLDDGSSSSSSQQLGWHLDRVCISTAALLQGAASSEAPVAWFYAQRWLHALHGLEAQLPALPADPCASCADFRVRAFTSDVRHAGTDCRVFLQLHGEARSSPPVELLQQQPAAAGHAEAVAAAASSAPFQRGGCDAFSLRLPHLGPLKLASLWLEGPQGSPWRLEQLAVTGPDGVCCMCGVHVSVCVAVVLNERRASAVDLS